MSHALIIEYNMLISRAVEDRLLPLGFASFDHAWTEPQAAEAARMRTPDLVVMGEIGPGDARDRLVREIVDEHAAPVVVIAEAHCTLYRNSPQGVAVSGRFPLSDIDAAVELSGRGNPLGLAA